MFIMFDLFFQISISDYILCLIIISSFDKMGKGFLDTKKRVTEISLIKFNFCFKLISRQNL